MTEARQVLYYSTAAEDEPVHHNNPSCSIGGQISITNIRLGDDGRPLCDECERTPAATLV